MVYQTRRTRISRRRPHYYQKRWRKHRRPWNHRYRRRTWHRRHRRAIPVRQPHPWPVKRLTVAGWEPLGFAGTVIERQQPQGTYVAHHGVKTNVEVTALKKLLSVDSPQTICQKNDCTIQDWAGGFGMANFSVQSLLDRARRGLCEFSTSMTTYTHMKFIGAKWYLVPAPTIDWLLYADSHFSNNQEDYKNVTKWLHPLHLVLQKKTRIVQSLQRKPRLTWKKVRIRPSPELCYRWYDKETFAKFLLASYKWSLIDLKNPFGPPGADALKSDSKLWYKNDWISQKDPQWLDRKNWDSKFLTYEENSWWTNWWVNVFGNGSSIEANRARWSPFCPPLYPGDPQAFYFFYYFHFQLAGKTFDNPLPGDPNHEVQQLPKCADFDPRKSSCGTCSGCIREGDLDHCGMLTDRALKRITRAHHKNKMGKKKEKTKKVKWADKEYPKEIRRLLRRLLN